MFQKQKVLQRIDRQAPNMIDAVFALLDTRDNWFGKAPKNSAFRDGASTVHIGAHIGILQRGQTSKLDREKNENAAENLSTLRRIVLNILQLDKTSTRSIKGKRKKAGWSNSYLAKLLKSFIVTGA